MPDTVQHLTQSPTSLQPFPQLDRDSLLPIQDVPGIIQSLPRTDPGRLGWTPRSRVHPIRFCPGWPVWCWDIWTRTWIYPGLGRNPYRLPGTVNALLSSVFPSWFIALNQKLCSNLPIFLVFTVHFLITGQVAALHVFPTYKYFKYYTRKEY